MILTESRTTKIHTLIVLLIYYFAASFLIAYLRSSGVKESIFDEFILTIAILWLPFSGTVLIPRAIVLTVSKTLYKKYYEMLETVAKEILLGIMISIFVAGVLFSLSNNPVSGTQIINLIYLSQITSYLSVLILKLP